MQDRSGFDIVYGVPNIKKEGVNLVSTIILLACLEGGFLQKGREINDLNLK